MLPFTQNPPLPSTSIYTLNYVTINQLFFEELENYFIGHIPDY